MPSGTVTIGTHNYTFADVNITSLAAYNDVGFNCIAVTDHNSIEGALAVKEIAPFNVIIGAEIKSTAGENIILSGSNNKNIQLLVNEINTLLGNYGNTIDIKKQNQWDALSL